MRIFAGYSALSECKRDSLLADLQCVFSGITNLYAQYIHFVEGEETLNTDGTQILKSLLHYGKEWGQSPLMPSSSEVVFSDTEVSYNNKTDYTTFVVVPRIGTISPWSSKATDIAHNTGLAITRIERGTLYGIEGDISDSDMHRIKSKLYDRMVENILPTVHDGIKLFEDATPKPMTIIPVLQHGIDAIRDANVSLRLALNEQEMEYLMQSYLDLGRDPSDVELYMFAQANSEHCRHKIFNASWNINGKEQNHSLFSMIRNTTYQSSNGVLSAYKDNAAVIAGIQASCFYPHPNSKTYHYEIEDIDLLMKVETHNHPTAISPYSGSATGVGGEIRDEGAAGLGAKTKAGLTGFTVSNLNIPNFIQRWEQKNNVYGKPAHIASALQIMIEAPVGGSQFSNEFGRPNLSGYFRTYEQVGYSSNGQEMYGYHKPIMIAGGMGNILRYHINKNTITVGSKLICLGGPAMRIGLSGGTASSIISSDSNAELDFASVQRSNAEMERRCQEVIDRCWQMGRSNPISFIHDVGAGGISNAFPELVKDGNVGGTFELRNVLLGEQGMSPLEIWSNESQERYVIAVPVDAIDTFDSVCRRERCPYAIVGEAVSEHHLTLNDMYFKNTPVDLPMNILFGNTPKMHRNIEREIVKQTDLDIRGITLDDAIEQVLKIPAVSSKSFLITIGDRSITGMVARDQTVGKWQVPVADCAVTTTGLNSITGEAMAMGERTPLAVINAPASGRMAIGETITNLASACIQCISDIHLSANWMVAAGYAHEDEKLFDTVRTVGMDFCPDLGIAIPVGKDSMSMRTTWKDTNTNTEKSVTSPLSLIISGFAPVMDTNKTLTPELRTDKGDTVLISVDIANGRNRLGGSCLAQAYNQVGNDVPDTDAQSLKSFFETTQTLNRKGVIVAYHDRSDGGVITTLLEMAFSGKTGLDITLPQGELISILFNEELGAVLQTATSNAKKVIHAYTSVGIDAVVIATPNTNDTIVITQNATKLYTQSRVHLQRVWAELSYRIQALRDNAYCAEQEFSGILDTANPGLHADVSFDINDDITTPFINTEKPKIAILREQGVNGHVEMAGAFTAACFEAVDIHMSDLHTGRVNLKDFNALVACGGFSYGDVLGAGGGWAKNILYTPHLKEQFEIFFARQDTLALGVCNGCQMFAQLKHIIPGAENWPQFIRNISEQFESRTSMLRIETSNSVWFDAMAETYVPIPVAHGEGRIMFESQEQEYNLINSHQITLRFVDGYGTPTEIYPQNPNGSLDGITGVSAGDGRIQIMMPHPERAYRSVTNSWKPDHWGQYGVWMRMFRNARKWLQ